MVRDEIREITGGRDPVGGACLVSLQVRRSHWEVLSRNEEI